MDIAGEKLNIAVIPGFNSPYDNPLNSPLNVPAENTAPIKQEQLDQEEEPKTKKEKK